MSFSPAPAHPQLDMSGAMPSLFSSYVLYDSGVGRPRDLVRNWLPKRTLGQGASNGGPDAVWQPSSYAPDGGSPSMRFLGNARTPIYPYGGVGQNTIAVGNLDLTSPFVRTYAVEFRLNAIPGRDQGGSVYPLVGQVASGYGGDNDNFAGRYKVTLDPTPETQFADGDYCVTVHLTGENDQVVAELGTTMHGGDDATYFPAGFGGNYTITPTPTPNPSPPVAS